MVFLMTTSESNLYDWCYEKVINDNPSKNELLDMCSKLLKAGKFNVGNNTEKLIFVLEQMSKSKHADDDVIEQIAKVNLKEYQTYDDVNLTHLILNNGSKKLFDKIWDCGLVDRMPHHFWLSKHTSESQLEFIYASFSGYKEIYDIVQSKRIFFQQPNVPEHLMLKEEQFFSQMAENPNLENKEIIFNKICDICKGLDINSKKEHQIIFYKLLHNDNINVKTLIEKINLHEYMRKLSSGGMVGDYCLEGISHFCKRKDCPKKISVVMYLRSKKKWKSRYGLFW